jgi:hypothetical protein
MISTLPPKRAGKWLTGLAILGLTVVGCGGNDTATTDTGEETSAGECGACTPLHPRLAVDLYHPVRSRWV